MRENRTHGSEGGDGESRSRPLSGLFSAPISLDTRFRRYDGTLRSLSVFWVLHSIGHPRSVFSKEVAKSTKVRSWFANSSLRGEIDVSRLFVRFPPFTFT